MKGAISTALYDTIITELLANSVSAENQAILDLVRPAIAHLTFAESALELSLTVDDRGITVFSNPFADMIENREAVDMARLQKLIDQAKEHGMMYLKNAEDKLQADATAVVYPDFFGSDNYNSSYTGKFVNDSDWGALGS